MTDIVETLRKLAAVDGCQASIEAADEIERLRVALKQCCDPLPLGMLSDDDKELAFREVHRRMKLAREALG